jgi:hypothetical protein
MNKFFLLQDLDNEQVARQQVQQTWRKKKKKPKSQELPKTKQTVRENKYYCTAGASKSLVGQGAGLEQQRRSLPRQCQSGEQGRDHEVTATSIVTAVIGR